MIVHHSHTILNHDGLCPVLVLDVVVEQVRPVLLLDVVVEQVMLPTHLLLDQLQHVLDVNSVQPIVPGDEDLLHKTLYKHPGIVGPLKSASPPTWLLGQPTRTHRKNVLEFIFKIYI